MIAVAMRSKTRPARLAELYDTHAGEALRLAYLLTGERELAEDLVQDAFIKVAGRFQDLRDPGAFGVYLKRTVVNLSHSTYRRRKVERTYVERESGRFREELPGPDLGERDRVWRALLQVPERQRSALVLRFYEDMSEEQIAEVMGAPKGTVKSLLSRGMAQLRETMAGETR